MSYKLSRFLTVETDDNQTIKVHSILGNRVINLFEQKYIDQIKEIQKNCGTLCIDTDLKKHLYENRILIDSSADEVELVAKVAEKKLPKLWLLQLCLLKSVILDVYIAMRNSHQTLF